MTLQNWLESRWLRVHRSSKDEVASLLNKADEDIAQAKNKDITLPWRLRMAYDAALTVANTALRVSGYRVSVSVGHHHKTIDSLKYTLESENELIITLQAIRKKRNLVSYDASGMTTEVEVNEAIQLAEEIKANLESWLETNYPDLIDS